MLSLQALLNPIDNDERAEYVLTSTAGLHDIKEDLESLFTLTAHTGSMSVPTAVKDALGLVLGHFCTQAQEIPSLPQLMGLQVDPSNVPSLSQSLSPWSLAHPMPEPLSVPPPTVRHNVIINRETTLKILYTYHCDAIVEYPETGCTGDVTIGHLFSVDPDNWIHPALNVSYSQGDLRGSTKRGQSVRCDVLVDRERVEVPCRVSHSTCMFIVNQMCLVLIWGRPRLQSLSICRYVCHQGTALQGNS
jgi:hypothetical protein